jgi:hypothetical protein
LPNGDWAGASGLGLKPFPCAENSIAQRIIFC